MIDLKPGVTTAVDALDQGVWDYRGDAALINRRLEANAQEIQALAKKIVEAMLVPPELLR